MTAAAQALVPLDAEPSDRVIFELVLSSRCSSCDCEFVALALTLDVPLVTEDRALLDAFPGRCCSLAQALEN